MDQFRHQMMNPFGEPEFDDPIRKFQHEYQQIIDSAERLRPLVKSCQDAIARTDNKRLSISLFHRGGLNPVEVKIMAMIDKSLEEVVPLFRELAKEGLKTDKNEPFKDQDLMGLMGMREYRLGPQLSVWAVIFSHSDEKDRCRLVQTGVKEVPVYGIQCDE